MRNSVLASLVLAVWAARPEVYRSYVGDRGAQMVSKQQLEKERLRQTAIKDAIVERRKLLFAALVRAGLKKPDVTPLAKHFATTFSVDDPSDLKPDSSTSLVSLVEASINMTHDMVCHVKGAGPGCESDWKDYVDMSLSAVSNAGTSLLQLLGAKPPVNTESSAMSVLEEGKVDEELSNLMKRHLRQHMKVLMKIGELPDAAKQIAMDAMNALKTEDMLEYVKLSKLQLAQKYVFSALSTNCKSATTMSCRDVLASEVSALGGGAVGSVALPVAPVLLKFMGIPDHPEETAAERAAVVEAYLQQRSIQHE